MNLNFSTHSRRGFSRFLLFCTLAICGGVAISLAEKSLPTLSPLIRFEEVTLSKRITKVNVDLSPIRDQLQDARRGPLETIYLCFLGGQTSLKKTPSWHVYFSREPDIQLTPRKTGRNGTSAPNPNYLGDLKFYSQGAWTKKTVHVMMAVRQDLLDSIAASDGKGFITLVLNSDSQDAEVAKKPPVLTDVSLQLQRTPSNKWQRSRAVKGSQSKK